MADMDDSINKISLQDKVRLLNSLKKVREAEIKEKGAKITKEIEELEEKRKKEMKALDEQLQKENNVFDEEMFKAMDALFFGDRRTYLRNRARLERKQEIDDVASEIHALKGESFLYDISEKIFAGQNLKLHEIITFEGRERQNENENRMYLQALSPIPSDEYKRQDSSTQYESNNPQQGPNSNNYSSNSKTWLEKFEENWNQRRNY